MQSCRRIAEQVAGKVEVHTELWKASVLDLPEAREAVRKDFAKADVIMVAGGDGAPLSGRLRDVLRDWAAGTDSRRAVMVAYHTPAAVGETDDQLALELLGEIVRDAGCDFISPAPTRQGADSVPDGWRVGASSVQAMTRWLPPAVTPSPRWGIND